MKAHREYKKHADKTLKMVEKYIMSAVRKLDKQTGEYLANHWGAVGEYIKTHMNEREQEKKLMVVSDNLKAASVRKHFHMKKKEIHRF